MKCKVTSEVNMWGLKVVDEYIQEYDENENVFGRVLIYHERMKRVFPNNTYKLINVEEIE